MLTRKRKKKKPFAWCAYLGCTFDVHPNIILNRLCETISVYKLIFIQVFCVCSTYLTFDCPSKLVMNILTKSHVNPMSFNKKSELIICFFGIIELYTKLKTFSEEVVLNSDYLDS